MDGEIVLKVATEKKKWEDHLEVKRNNTKK